MSEGDRNHSQHPRLRTNPAWFQTLVHTYQLCAQGPALSLRDAVHQHGPRATIQRQERALSPEPGAGHKTVALFGITLVQVSK